MKLKVVLVMFVLGTIAIFSLFGTAQAATDTVTPSVTLGTALSLTLQDTANVQWGSQSPGTTQTGTIQAIIGANTSWNLTVLATDGYPSTNELTDGSHRITSSYFTYTSSAGTPAPAGTGISSDTEFDGSNDSNVWTGGTATDDCSVEITYSLEIPASQSPGAYAATHTYTLASS